MATTTFFINNLSEELTVADIWEEAGRIGRVTDVCIPRKKDSRGGRFGFIRFKNVKDTEKYLKALNNIRVGGLKISANLAKFDKWGRKILSYDKFGDRDKGASAHRAQESGFAAKGFRYGGGSGVSFKQLTVGGQSSGVLPDVLSIHRNHESWPGMRKWIKLSLLGEAFNVSSLQEVGRKLRQVESLGRTELRYIGGLRVLITLESEAKANLLLHEGKNVWEEVFSSLSIWEGQALNFQRVAWIKIQGVSPNLWDSSVFDQIGIRYGRIIHRSEASLSDGDLSSDYLAVLVNAGESVNDSFTLTWKDLSCKVWVSEVMEGWKPDFGEVSIVPKLSVDEVGEKSAAPDIGGLPEVSVTRQEVGGESNSCMGKEENTRMGEPKSCMGIEEINDEVGDGGDLHDDDVNVTSKEQFQNQYGSHMGASVELEDNVVVTETPMGQAHATDFSSQDVDDNFLGHSAPVLLNKAHDHFSSSGPSVGGEDTGIVKGVGSSKKSKQSKNNPNSRASSLPDLNLKSSDEVHMRPSKRFFSYCKKTKRRSRGKKGVHSFLEAIEEEEWGDGEENGSSEWVDDSETETSSNLQSSQYIVDEDTNDEQTLSFKTKVANEVMTTMELGEKIGVRLKNFSALVNEEVAGELGQPSSR